MLEIAGAMWDCVSSRRVRNVRSGPDEGRTSGAAAQITAVRPADHARLRRLHFMAQHIALNKRYVKIVRSPKKKKKKIALKLKIIKLTAQNTFQPNCSNRSVQAFYQYNCSHAQVR